MKKIVLGIMFLGIIGAAFYGYDQHRKFNTGYCFAENRYLTDAEIYEPAIEELVRRLGKRYDSFSPKEQDEHIYYPDAKTFKQINSGCCSPQLNKISKRRPALAVDLENSRGYSFRLYIAYREKTREQKINTGKVEIYVSACGEVQQIRDQISNTLLDKVR